MPGVYSSTFVRDRRHQTEKPVGLVEWLLSILPAEGEGIIVDPFAGVATTAVAADGLGRDSVLVEKNPEIFSLALEHLGAEGFTVYQESDPNNSDGFC